MSHWSGGALMLFAPKRKQRHTNSRYVAAAMGCLWGMTSGRDSSCRWPIMYDIDAISADTLQEHHRDFSRGLGLVVGEARHELGMMRVEPVALRHVRYNGSVGLESLAI